MLIKYRGQDPHGTFRMGQLRFPTIEACQEWIDSRSDWQSLTVANATRDDWASIIWRQPQ